MMRIFHCMAAIAIAVALGSAASSASAGTGMGGDDCGKPVKMTRKLIRSLGAPDESFPGQGKLPPFLLATQEREFEKVQYLFAKRGGRWRGWIYTTNAPAGDLRVSSRHGMAMMFGMWGVEGPGKNYTVLSTRDGFRTVQCNLLPGPAEPKNPNGSYTTTYMSIMSAGGDRHGRATITGEVDWEEDGRITRYVSRARLGRDWPVPKRTTLKRAAAGVFAPLKSSRGAWLMHDLRRSVGLKR